MDHYKLTLAVFLIALGSNAFGAPIRSSDCSADYSRSTNLTRSECDAQDDSKLTRVPVTQRLHKTEPRLPIDNAPLTRTYDTTFRYNLKETNDIQIKWFGGTTSIKCMTQSCILLVNGDKHNPALYLFELTDTWNATASSDFKEFPADRDAISNIAFPAQAARTTLPEPDMLLFFALGLVGLGFGVRYRHHSRYFSC